jgi:hypothetical protein
MGFKVYFIVSLGVLHGSRKSFMLGVLFEVSPVDWVSSGLGLPGPLGLRWSVGSTCSGGVIS